MRIPKKNDDRILSKLAATEVSGIRERVRAGIASIRRGEFTEYEGRAGLRQLAEDIKTRGRQRLGRRDGQA